MNSNPNCDVLRCLGLCPGCLGLRHVHLPVEARDLSLRAALVGPQLGLGHVEVRARLLQLEAHVDGLRQRRLERIPHRRVLPMSVEARLGLLRRRPAVVGGGGGARGGPPSARGAVELHLAVLDGGVGIVVEEVLRGGILAGVEHPQLVRGLGSGARGRGGGGGGGGCGGRGLMPLLWRRAARVGGGGGGGGRADAVGFLTEEGRGRRSSKRDSFACGI